MYSSYQLDIGYKAFKQAFATHRNAVSTTVKRNLKTIGCDGREKEEMFKKDLERNMTLCLHSSRNRDTTVDPLTCFKQNGEEQRCRRTASNSVRMATDVSHDTEIEWAEWMSEEEKMEH